MSILPKPRELYLIVFISEVIFVLLYKRLSILSFLFYHDIGIVWQ